MMTFNGYPRPNGRVGVRNHVVVTTTVSCANGVVERIAKEVPGIVPIRHVQGCDGSHGSPYFLQTLRRLCLNPNHYAIILIGLGCEKENAKELAEQLEKAGKRVFCRTIQHDGGSEAVVRDSIKAAKLFLEGAKTENKVPCPIDKLVLGTICGDSDAFSGITANPVIGYMSDWLVANGGTSILSETSELTGCEELLAERAISKEVADKVRKIIIDTNKQMIVQLGETAGKMMSCGNMTGGLTTIAEKSLGSVKKCGHSPVVAVIDYGNPVDEFRGLVIQDGPGYVPESITGLFASGAQICVFSSGKGNPIGFPSCPIIKICSNTAAYDAVGGDGGDIDLNAGAIITENVSLEKMGERAIKLMLDVINGKDTVSECHNMGSAVGIHKRLPVEKRCINHRIWGGPPIK